MKLSTLAATLSGSEIVKIGSDIREMIRKGEKVFNFTVGDFDPAIFPIPELLEKEIIEAYHQHFTNYPAPEGNLDLRESIGAFHQLRQNLHYTPEEILVASGGRPLIYATYQTLCDEGEKIIYPIPSWNNNHYTHFVKGEAIVIETTAAHHFMPTAAQMRPHLKGAALIALCSPQNPTGTTIRKEALEAICDMVLEENARRSETEKKLYLMYDQMYWQLTYGDIRHYDPVRLRPSMRPYTIYIDAISKVFAATGLRVGWALGPAPVIAKMKALLTHIGTWSPMAEQKGVARFLTNQAAIDSYLEPFKKALKDRLNGIYEACCAMKQAGLPIDVIAPEAAIYLTLKINATGLQTPAGTRLSSQQEVADYILKEAKVALVPFYAFGNDRNSAWYRLSVGTCRMEDIGAMTTALRNALEQLQSV